MTARQKNKSEGMETAIKLDSLRDIISTVFPKEHTDQIKSFLCQDITYAFLFERKFFKQKTEVPEIPFKLISTGEVFNIEEYPLVKDFIVNYSGSLEWDEDSKDFETYSGLLFLNLVNEIEEKISEVFEEKYGEDSYQKLMNEVSKDQKHAEAFSLCSENMKTITTNIWTEFLVIPMSEVIEKYEKFIMEEEFTSMQERDTELEVISTHAFLYQEIVEELIEDYDLNLRDYENITSKNKDVLAKLNQWAETVGFDKLEIVEAFLPSSQLNKFKWLDKEIYARKEKDLDEVTNKVDKFFAEMGVSLLQNKISFYTVSLYSLLNEVFKLPNEKIITIYGSEAPKAFCLDEYNRILKISNFKENTNVVDAYDKMLTELDYQMNAGGTIIVKSILGKQTVKKGREIFEVISYELRAAYFIHGTFIGLKKTEAEKFISLTQDERNKATVVGWPIGNQNLSLTFIDRSNHNDDDDDEDEED